MKMRPFGRLLPAPEALARVLEATHRVPGTERVAVGTAVGRVAAAGWRASRAVPDAPRATWDGYALRSADTRGARPDRPARFSVVGEVYAEESTRRRVGRGEAMAIATGGRLPAGTDTVAIFEETRMDGATITVERFHPKGDRLAAVGDDIARGAVVVAPGTVIDPAAAGALAATGCARIPVYRRPRVALLANGNELVPPGRPARRGRIVEINSLTLGALVAAAGGLPEPYPPIADDPAAIEATLRSAVATHDAVLVSGGSSVGEHDYLPAIFPRIGRLLFHGIAVRPGKPTLAAVRGRRLLLGLPGHPTSCLANGLWMVLPMVRRLAGLPGPGWVEVPVRVAEPIPAGRPGVTTVVPLRVSDGRATPTFKDSSAITSLVGANAFLFRAPGSRRLPRGTSVPARLLPGPIGAPPSA